MHNKLPVFIVLVLALATLPAQAAPISTVSKDYTVGVGELESACSPDSTNSNQAGACFHVPSGTVAATIEVDDEFPRHKVAALVSHYIGQRFYASWYVCETWQWLGVPPDVTLIRIDLQSVGALHACDLTVPATYGTITITWHNAE